MRIFNFPDKLDFFNTAIALGTFDGVHLAHRKIIDSCVDYSKKNNLKSGVVILEGNLKGNLKDNLHLTSIRERLFQIEKMGVDFVYICKLSDEFLKKSPIEFIELLKDSLFAKAIFAGYNYRFGYKALGDAKLLAELSLDFDIKTFICPEQKMNEKTISSTEIKQMLLKRDLKGAKSFLGKNYSLFGVVKKGFQNGGKLGFRTANLEFSPKKLLLPDGVYLGKVIVDDKEYKALINIGKNPTFDAQKRTVESHILDFSGELYGEEITVEFLEFLRDEIKFENLDLLKEQIAKDKEVLKNL